MRNAILLIAMAAVASLSTLRADIISSVFWDDGQPHVIDDDTYVQEGYQYYIHSDFNINNNPPTQVSLVNGGAVGSLRAFNSSINAMSGGIAGFLQSFQNSQITMSGGTADYLGAHDNGTITISGGTIIDHIRASKNGTIYLKGTGFEVGGQMLSYGDRLSDFVSASGGGGDPYYTGTVTGTLLDGTSLNCDFEVYNTGFNAGTADIIIIPEPTTLLLLGMGGLLIRKRK